MSENTNATAAASAEAEAIVDSTATTSTNADATRAFAFYNHELPLPERVADLVSRLTLEEKIGQMPQYQEEVPRLGLSKYKHGTEGAHGIAWLGEATVFPQPIGLASTWDEELLRQVGEAIGTEARVFYQRDPERNGLTIWAPTVDMERDARWGRTEEAYGEDPLLAGKLTAALARGMQGDDPAYLRAVATLKHFYANNNELHRGFGSASIDARSKREYYLKVFELAFKEGGAKSMMTAYNSVNGVPANLLDDIEAIVRGEWGMDGFVVSDAGDVLGTVHEHKHVDSYAEAAALSIRAGIDSITDDAETVKRAIRDALEQGLLEEADLDRALSRTFSVRMRLGEFDPPGLNPYEGVPEEKVGSPEHAALSRLAAEKSVVLLRNEPAAAGADGTAAPQSEAAAAGSEAATRGRGESSAASEAARTVIAGAAAGDAAPLLPLAPQGRIAVIGPLADEAFTDWYSGTPPYRSTPLAGIRERLADAGEAVYATGGSKLRLRSVTSGRYVGSGPVLTADAAGPEEAEIFEATDWGYGNVTLRAQSSGKLVTDAEDGLTASADEARGWFVKEVFRLEDAQAGLGDQAQAAADGVRAGAQPAAGAGSSGTAAGSRFGKEEERGARTVELRTWDGTPVGLLADGRLMPAELAPEAAVNAADAANPDAAAEAERAERLRQRRKPAQAERFLVEVVEDGISAAVRLAASADAAVVVVGNQPFINGKEDADRPGIALAAAQQELIRAVLRANPRTAVLLVSSYPFALEGLEREAPAILQLCHASQELGRAAAGAIFGDYSPAGRLPMTWPATEQGMPSIMDYDIIRSGRTYHYGDISVLYPFGHGLSYAAFRYGELRVDREALEAGDAATVRLEVTNESGLEADEVVQLYARIEGSAFQRPKRQLVGFRRLRLAAGETATAEFRVEASQLAVWDPAADRWAFESGVCRLLAGASSADIRAEAQLRLDGEPLAARPLGDWTAASSYDEARGLAIDACRDGGDSVRPAGADAAALTAAFAGGAPGQGWARFGRGLLPAGADRFEARVSGAGSGSVELRLGGPDGELLARCDVPRTGGPQAWTTVAAPLALPAYSAAAAGRDGADTVSVVLRGEIGLARFRVVKS
ncbi:Beta-glucosidase [Paenibacillus pasadenensis]|uniref:Beta-glucosidase n=1 Tax=Paenibacillus pasadenensis TaxID=217090 RepID=A0A2N5NBX9_9BACL|nr:MULTISPECIES: glycoside hydrolase family 3 C-terminal domain-containing protein [Paenibacillus]PLT47838.1 Beta-glucosidase [Paenibacillus pasadenensis]QGG58004.1 carbohydrate-binding protein [Paenibacillus sp. B01]